MENKIKQLIKLWKKEGYEFNYTVYDEFREFVVCNGINRITFPYKQERKIIIERSINLKELELINKTVEVLWKSEED